MSSHESENTAAQLIDEVDAIATANANVETFISLLLSIVKIAPEEVS